MKEVNSIKKVSLTFDELMSCSIIPSNRCGYLTQEEALKNGFSIADWDEFIKRATKLKKIIKTKNFSKASFFVLAKDETNKLYILDGQGRRMALAMINEDEDIRDCEFICDLYCNPLSITEMSSLIRDMNTANTNWKSKDVRRSDAIASGDREVQIAFEYTKSLIDNYGLTDYMANLLTFGERASHQRSVGSILSTRDYSPTKDLFTELYIKVIEELSYTEGPNGERIKHPLKLCRKIRNNDFGISFVACLRKILIMHGGNVANAKSDLLYFIDKIITTGKGDQKYVENFVKCGSKEQRVVADKVRKSCGRKKSLREALYSF